MGVLEALRMGVEAATGASKRLARVWTMTAGAANGCFHDAAMRTTWMPSHGALHTIGTVMDSNGQPITALMWRANRLADILAKHAASPNRVPSSVTTAVRDFVNLARHCIAKLGAVTLAANRHAVEMVDGAGVTRSHYLRDSEG